ncbi:GPW/gp25 family protein [Fluviicola sp. SGL-29]|nr:GPW/gp25 family protein [Fluviicola sp. SGL-29]
MMNNNDFLGIGWEFPPAFEKKGVRLVESNTDIRESLRILLSTTQGERIFRPEYGCNIRRWVFSKMTLSERTLITDTIKQAVKKGEPRIVLNQVSVEIKDALEGILWINLNYTIITTNTPDNLVFPFYFKESIR